MREHFTDEELLDLGMTLGFTLGWQRLIETVGIRPDGWTAGQRPPWAATPEVAE